MGKASGLKRLRREAAGAGRFARIQARPEVAAHQAAMLEDAELQARWRADLPAQQTRLRRAGWARAAQGNDGAGWWSHPASGLTLVHSVDREPDGNLWGHVSVSGDLGRRLPSWAELRDAQRLLYPDLAGLQVIAPESGHVNIAEAAHAWTCLTAVVIPDFGRMGTI